MIDAVPQSVKAFVTGKLFRHPLQAYGLLTLGVAVSAGVFVASVELGLPLYASVALGGFVGGVLQPRLYRDLKYQ